MTLLLITLPAISAGFMLGYFYRDAMKCREVITLKSKLKAFEKMFNKIIEEELR